MNICKGLTITSANNTTIHAHDFTYGFHNDYSISNCMQQLDVQSYAGVHESKFTTALMSVKNTNGSLKGNTFANDITTTLPATVSTMYRGKVLHNTDGTIDGFTLLYLDTTKKYDLIAKPLSGTYEGKVIYGVSPNDDILCYRFVVYANYNKKVNTKYGFQVQVADAKDDLSYVLDDAAPNISIDQKGYVTVEYVPGEYIFTVNVSSPTLKITKQLIINITVV